MAEREVAREAEAAAAAARLAEARAALGAEEAVGQRIRLSATAMELHSVSEGMRAAHELALLKVEIASAERAAADAAISERAQRLEAEARAAERCADLEASLSRKQHAVGALTDAVASMQAELNAMRRATHEVWRRAETPVTTPAPSPPQTAGPFTSVSEALRRLEETNSSLTQRLQHSAAHRPVLLTPR